MPRTVGTIPASAHSRAGILGALGVRPFRRLWLVLGLSALGDWLGLLASASFASAQVITPSAKGLAFGSVIAVQLLPALFLGPVAGVLADRLDRRLTMVVVDLFRFLLYLSIPLVGLVSEGATTVAWAAIAIFAIQSAALLWVPAKEAAVPNLLPGRLLEPANQLTLVTTYGVGPVVGALVFAGLAAVPYPAGLDPASIALWFDAVTFLASAAVVFFAIPEVSGRTTMSQRQRPDRGPFGDFVDGGRYILRTALVRGVVVGIVGAFAGAGIVVGTAKFYAQSLGGGDATFAILFAVLFAGFGVGVAAGPRIVGPLSRRRWFALSIILAGGAVVALALMPRLLPATVAAFVTGAGAGMAFLAGITLLGREVGDDVRGRVFAFIQTAVRVTLIASIAVAGIVVGVGSSRRLTLGPVQIDVATSRILLLVAGLVGIALGYLSLRQFGDDAGAPVWSKLRRGLGRRAQRESAHPVEQQRSQSGRTHPPADHDRPDTAGDGAAE